MNPIIREEKKLYFTSRYDELICRLTRDQNYYLWKYVKLLRQEEAARTPVGKLFYRRRKNVLGHRLGIAIWAGCFGKGLRIWHPGNVIVNGYAHIGENCTLRGQNCIGTNSPDPLAVPRIGSNVDIGMGASVLGDITIADGVKIGAGAVVVHSCLTPGATLVGVPARELPPKE